VDLTGKVAVVTGAAGGIGGVYAEALLAHGASVVLADVDGAALVEAQEHLTVFGAAVTSAVVDVIDEASAAAMVTAATAAFGGVDILVNNAALHLGDWSAGLQLPADRWRRILDVNVVGALVCTAACRSSMAARGGGVVVNQSSLAAYSAAAGAYSVSKAALNALTATLARELAAEGTRVNGIAPGFVASPAAVARVLPANRERAVSAQLLAREGLMSDLVGTLLYLVSDQSSFVTGQTISVDGGAARRY
jgi:NAD(P)-dependent dehydrogenase (short-subunit alcohol dehydrogenase family)